MAKADASGGLLIPAQMNTRSMQVTCVRWQQGNFNDEVAIMGPNRVQLPCFLNRRPPCVHGLSLPSEP